MEKSSSYDELMVIHQFDRKCKLALDGEVVDYERHMAYRRKHKVMFSGVSEKVKCSLFVIDKYEIEKYNFLVAGGYDVEVKDTLLVEVLKPLTERKRDVILLHNL